MELKEYNLYNRYRVPVSLRQMSEDSNDFLLVLPEKEMDWVQVSYDLELVKDENGIEQKVEKDYSVDPSGGPYITIGGNKLGLYPYGEIYIIVDSIELKKDVGYVLKISFVEYL